MGRLVRMACVGLLAGCAMCRAAGCGHEAPGTEPAPSEPRQTECPVSGGPVRPDHYVMYEGEKLYFRDRACKLRFMKDPERYAARAAEVME